MISVILPVFNEQENIPAVAYEVSRQLERLTASFELIFVDDGSTDESLRVLADLSRHDSHIKAVRLSRNFGHQVAISAGLEYARGDAVIVMDADLQHPPELIPELIAHWKDGYDVVYTIRLGQTHANFFKRFTAALFYRVLNHICDIDISIDANTPDFRLLDRRVVDVLRRLPERARFVRGLVRWVGFRQKAVHFTARRRTRGTTKYPLSRMLRFSMDGVTAFSTMPLRFASYLGGLAALGAIPYAGWAVYKRLFTDDAVHGWASVVVAVLILGGVQLICLGIIGEYLGRVYEESKGRPLYITDEVIGDFDTAIPASEPRSATSWKESVTPVGVGAPLRRTTSL